MQTEENGTGRNRRNKQASHETVFEGTTCTQTSAVITEPSLTPHHPGAAAVDLEFTSFNSANSFDPHSLQRRIRMDLN